eukprot:6491170-Amphidinium_carterae.1
MSCRAVVGTVFDESVECHQSLLEGVSVGLEKGVNVAGDTHRYSSFRGAILPYGLSTEREPLDIRGTRACHRTCGSAVDIGAGAFNDPIINVLIVPAFNAITALHGSKALQGYLKASAEAKGGEHVSLRDPQERGANFSTIGSGLDEGESRPS